MRTVTRLLFLLIDLAASGLHPSLGEIRVANDLTSLCLKKSCSSPIICLFLFMAKVCYFIVLLLQYSCNQWIIKHFSVFYL